VISSAKAAQLQATSTSGKPVLMSIDFEGCHPSTPGVQSDALDMKAVLRVFFRRAPFEP